jgi:enoyl-CoA hydratase
MIHREDRGDVTVLRMEHGKVNAFDVELCEAFSAELDNLARLIARPIVLTSQRNCFSAGVDLVRVVEGGRTYLEKFRPALTDALLKLFSFPWPIVAAINGHAIAGGGILACACDVRIAAEGSGRIGMPELLIGVPLPAITIEVLRFAVPPSHLPQLAYFGRTFSPAEALRMGLVEEVVPASQLLGHAFRTANQLGTIPDKAFSLTKRELREPYLRRFQEVRAKVDAEILEAWCSPSTLERLKVYVHRTLKK